MTEGIFEKDWKLNFTQCYPNGQLKYSELDNILQVTASEHADILGFGTKAILRTKQSWVLSRMLIEIEKLPMFEQTIKVRTWIQDFTGSRSTRNFEVLFGERRLIASTSLWAVFNIEARRAEPLIASTDHVVPHPDRIMTSRTAERIDGNVSFNKIRDYQVVLSDLDIVDHANNVKYMDWCFDALDPKDVLTGKIKSIEMNFLRELSYGNQVAINEAKIDELTSIYSISKADRPHFLMQLTKKG